jgi:hypothetical protein
MFTLKMMSAAILCLVFGIWGIYDYAVAIPGKQKQYDSYLEITQRKEELEKKKAANQMPTPQEALEYQQLEQALDRIGTPIPPSKFDRAMQWMFILSLPCAPWCFWMYIKAKRQVYKLDENDTLTFTGDDSLASGEWTAAEIADIDMSRWMAKSIAWAVHSDGKRLKLDAFLHQDLHLIIGRIAHRFYPDQWDIDAKIVKDSPAPAE